MAIEPGPFPPESKAALARAFLNHQLLPQRVGRPSGISRIGLDTGGFDPAGNRPIRE
jgi:hypothetical protein